MTVTAVFATEDYALGISDLRRTHMETGEHFDDAPKVCRAGDCLAGYSGHWAFGTRALEILKRELQPGSHLEKAAAIGQAYLDELWKHVPRDETDLTLFFAGRDEGGRMAIIDISTHTDYQAMKTEIPPGGIQWRYAFADYDPGPWLERQFKGAQDFPLPWVRRVAKKMIKQAAKLDKYVSKECRIVVLE